MGNPLVMLALFFTQFHQATLERDMYRLSRHQDVPTLRYDLRRAPPAIRRPILTLHYWRAVGLLAHGCCDSYYK